MRLARVAAALVLTLVSVAGSGGAASAASSTQVVQGRYLRIVSVADWDAAGRMRAGTTVPWDLTISADARQAGTMTIGVSATGDLPIVLTVRTCARAWVGDRCPPGSRTVRSGWAPHLGAQPAPLLTVPTSVTIRLRVSVRMLGAVAPGRENPATTLTVHARGEGDVIALGAGGTLAETGGDASTAPLAVGAGAILAGGALLGAHAVRRRRTGARP